MRHALLLLALLATGCLTAGGEEGNTESGIASWYGDRFHGRPTAGGEPFNMHALTAAHPSLPFGTVVEVENLENGRTVRVRINDRGPFVDGRIIDLSRAAAQRIGMLGTGVARVTLRVVARAPEPETPTIQVASFRESRNARAAQKRLEAAGLSVSLEDGSGGVTRVVVAACDGDVDGTVRRLKDLGFPEVLVRGAQ
jgi:rare lipoprotein A